MALIKFIYIFKYCLLLQTREVLTMLRKMPIQIQAECHHLSSNFLYHNEVRSKFESIPVCQIHVCWCVAEKNENSKFKQGKSYSTSTCLFDRICLCGFCFFLWHIKSALLPADSTARRAARRCGHETYSWRVESRGWEGGRRGSDRPGGCGRDWECEKRLQTSPRRLSKTRQPCFLCFTGFNLIP